MIIHINKMPVSGKPTLLFNPQRKTPPFENKPTLFTDNVK